MVILALDLHHHIREIGQTLPQGLGHVQIDGMAESKVLGLGVIGCAAVIQKQGGIDGDDNIVKTKEKLIYG